MRFIFKVLCFTSMIASFVKCTRITSTEKEIHNTINKQLDLSMLKCVINKDSSFTFKEFRQRNIYISIIYLQDGCKPCYPKFIEWHKKMDSLSVKFDNKYTILFVIDGENYNDFMQGVVKIDSINNKFYTALDDSHLFLRKNNTIPRWILDATCLIDKENKIKMVGPPWINNDMMALFQNIINPNNINKTHN